MSQKRQSWHEYFLAIARQVSSRSTCSRASVGAVFVRDNRILVTGYNGSPAGIKHCEHHEANREYMEEQGDLLNGYCWRAVHAEMNAVFQAAILGVSLKDSVLYCTHEPCLECSKAIIQIGCKEVYFINEKEHIHARQLMKSATVKVVRGNYE